MKKYFFFSLLIAICFISCGPSEEEKATIRKFYTDSLATTRITLEIWQELLQEQKLQLEVENSKMVSIKQYEFLRTEDENADQIREQRMRIMDLEKDIKVNEIWVTHLRHAIPQIQDELAKYK